MKTSIESNGDNSLFYARKITWLYVAFIGRPDLKFPDYHLTN